jgi:hypothetical protein
MANQIRELPGQVIVASHSPDFVGRARGTVAVMRSIGGAARIREIDTAQRWYREHPRVVFARCVFVTEGFEADMLPVFSKALDIDLDGSGIEVVNSQGQESMKPIWEVFGPKGLGMPVVLLADADVPETLRKFLKGAGVPVPPNPDDCISELRQFNYYTCRAGECLELELAAIEQGRWIDEAFLAGNEPTLQDWLENNKRQKIGEAWRNKLGTTYRTVADLKADLVKAKAYRLSRVKYDLPARVAELMTKDGTDDRLMPDRVRQALQRAAELAVG